MNAHLWPCAARLASTCTAHHIPKYCFKDLPGVHLTVCVVWDVQGIPGPTTHLFQEEPGHWGATLCWVLDLRRQFLSIKCLHFWSKTPLRLLCLYLPHVKDTRRCFLMPGKHGSPNVCVSAITEQFGLPWHLRDTFFRAEGDKHSEEQLADVKRGLTGLYTSCLWEGGRNRPTSNDVC